MINEIKTMQIKAIQNCNNEMDKEIRKMQIELDNLREENSRIIEKLMIPQKKQLDFQKTFFYNTDWLTSVTLLRVIDLKKQLKQIDESKIIDLQKQKKLQKEMEQLQAKKDELMNAKQALEEEYTQMVNECEKEKEQLKEFFASIESKSNQ